MPDFRQPIRLAAAALFAAAGLHILVILVTAGSYWLPMTIIAILWCMLAYSLTRGNRWLAMLAFLAAAFGGSVALGFGMNDGRLTALLFYAIALADYIASALLFAILWGNPRSSSSH